MASQPPTAGKMVRPRLAARARTPYDRPRPSSNSPSHNPNWVSRFVLSPTRLIASGAGKLFSSVLDLESSPTSSSSFTSSPSASDTDSSAEEVGTFNDENDNHFQGDDAVKKRLRPFDGSSKNKHFIEQLLMQESFSREESDRLIKIIRSRVVDSPPNDDDVDKRPRDVPNGILGSDSPDLCTVAVMEAKKWLQEKKSGSDLNSDLGYGSHSLNLAISRQAFKDEGSPVDVAKSYMLTRPPWASPSIDHTKSLSLIGTELFREEKSHLIGGNSASSSKLKRDCPAIKSWSIQNERRRVRSRATEQLLRTPPSTKIDWLELAVEYKNNYNSSATENIEARLVDKVHNFTDMVDASSDLARLLSTQAFPDLESKQDEFRPEAVLSDQANVSAAQGCGAAHETKADERLVYAHGSDGTMNRDSGLVKVNGYNVSNGTNPQQNSVEETREASNSRLHDGNCSAVREEVGADALANGFTPPGPSSYAEQVIELNTNILDNEPSTVGSGAGKPAKGAPENESGKMLRETPTEEPDVTVNETLSFKEDDGVTTGSQNSSSVQNEVQREYSQPDLAATPSSIAKQKGIRNTKYNRRGRVRGRGRGRGVK